MQGSKERIILPISTGFSILSIFEPIKDFSPTPLVPFESLGDIFQAVGVIIL